jgi:hypothetical protein
MAIKPSTDRTGLNRVTDVFHAWSWRKLFCEHVPQAANRNAGLVCSPSQEPLVLFSGEPIGNGSACGGFAAHTIIAAAEPFDCDVDLSDGRHPHDYSSKTSPAIQRVSLPWVRCHFSRIFSIAASHASFSLVAKTDVSISPISGCDVHVTCTQ